MANQPELDVDEQKLLLALLKTISAGWISASQFERLVRDFNIPEGAPVIYFLTGIKQIIRELPFKVFEDDLARITILEAAQGAIDAAIAREETALDSEISEESGS